jgi:hypothetical protein
MGIGLAPDLDQTIQNAKNTARQKIGEKVLKNVSDTLKQPPLSIDKADNLPILVGRNVEKESTFKEFFVKKNEGHEVFVLGIYPRSNERLIEWSTLLESGALEEEERRFRLGVSKVQNLRNLAEAARKAKESMNKQLGEKQ